MPRIRGVLGASGPRDPTGDRSFLPHRPRHGGFVSGGRFGGWMGPPDQPQVRIQDPPLFQSSREDVVFDHDDGLAYLVDDCELMIGGRDGQSSSSAVPGGRGLTIGMAWHHGLGRPHQGRPRWRSVCSRRPASIPRRSSKSASPMPSASTPMRRRTFSTSSRSSGADTITGSLNRWTHSRHARR